MKIEKIGKCIKEILNEYDFFVFLMKISDYIAYFVSFMVVINQLAYLGDFANAVWTYLFISTVILCFASRKYISLEILFISVGLANLYSFIKQILIFNTHTFSWNNFFGIIVCALLTSLWAKLYKSQINN